MREMAESDSSSDISSRSSITDQESIISSSDSLSSDLSDVDDASLSISHSDEVLPYRFEPEPSPEPSPGESHLHAVESGDTPDSRIGNTNW